MRSESTLRSPGGVRSLSFHADYQCGNSGICCSSGWDIAVESSVEKRLNSDLLRPGLELPNGPDGFEGMLSPPSHCSVALRKIGGACWFHEGVRHSCSIHRGLGEAALPSACRQFPRVCVLEPERVAVSLSHYCPTAARLLFSDGAPFGVVDAPPAFPTSWPFEGLDVRNAWPPFLRPGVLLGHDGWREVERCVVATIERASDAESGLQAVETALEKVASWRFEDGPVPEFVQRSFREPGSSRKDRQRMSDPRFVLRQSLPDQTTPPGLPEWQDDLVSVSRCPADVDLALRRYLAARTVACWLVYFGNDIRILGRYLRLCLAVVELFASRPGTADRAAWLEAVRSSDLWLMHHCDPERIARHLR